MGFIFSRPFVVTFCSLLLLLPRNLRTWPAADLSGIIVQLFYLLINESCEEHLAVLDKVFICLSLRPTAGTNAIVENTRAE